jgi:RNA-binding protein
MALEAIKIKQLRAVGHKLKPILTVSENGVSDNILNELERALNDHELIKVKFNVSDRDDKNAAIDALLVASKAECIQRIGKIALLYRLAKKTNKKLSNLHRPI